MVHHPVHPEAAVVLERLGGSVANFSARQLTPRIAVNADLIVTMTKSHRDKVLEGSPRLLRRTFTLAEVAVLAAHAEVNDFRDLAAFRHLATSARLSDILDPIGQDASVFANVGQQIARSLAPLMDLCKRESTSSQA